MNIFTTHVIYLHTSQIETRPNLKTLHSKVWQSLALKIDLVFFVKIPRKHR